MCEAQVCHYYSQSECYDLKFKTFAPTIPQSLSLLSSPAQTRSLSRPHVSGTFSMALNATVPYFIEAVVGGGPNPPQRRAMRSCIRDVSFGTRGPRRMERKQKKDEGGPAHVSLCFEGLCRSFLFCISLLAPARCKEKLPASLTSIRALNDCCTLMCFLLTVTQTDTIMSQPFLTAGIMPLNLCGFDFKLQYNLACSMQHGWICISKVGPNCPSYTGGVIILINAPKG